MKPTYSVQMSSFQIKLTVDEIVEHFQMSSKAADFGDKFTACNEARIGLKLFYSIDEKNISIADIDSYKGASNTIRQVIRAMQGVCD